jgi:predicted AlkP superfamily phosphohydrolase/phosphomutase
MTPRNRVFVVGLDACDPVIAQRLAMEGKLPALRRLFDSAARCELRNPVGLFVGALWMSFATGTRADRHGFHCWDEIDVDTYMRRLTRPSGEDVPFWHALSDAGRKIAAFDVPHLRAGVPVNGFELTEWGSHDRHFGFRTWPPKAAADIEAAFGLHPILGIDPYAVREFAADDYAHRAGQLRTLDEDRALFDGLVQGIRTKRGIKREVLGEGGFDFVVSILGESHAIGHQQWHLHDTSHRRYDPARVAAVGGDPIAGLYRELDESLGDMLAQAGDDDTVLVLLSHGMGPHNEGCRLLDEVLARIDAFDREPPAEAGLRGALKRTTRALPGRTQQRITAFAMPVLRQRLDGKMPQRAREYVEAEDRARQRFFLEPNNYVYGGVRFNMAGREPNGCVQPDELDAVVKRLTEDLFALVNVETGGPVVRDVIRADRWYRRGPRDKMPDLFIDWERNAPIETIWSAKIGVVHAPYTHWRTGDHRPHGVLLAYGPGIPTRTALPMVHIEDLAPGIAARLGVTLPDVDGRVPAWLA